MFSAEEKVADIHCHIVPGVDDGARTLEESIAILKEEYEQGVRLAIATPHWRRGMFETDRRIVYDRFCALKKSAGEKFPDLQLYLGCEFHVNPDMIDEMNADKLLRMNGSDYVLTEFSAHHDQNYIRDIINQEISSGYLPIIAHIERYPACVESLDFIYELEQMGAMVQVNADSITGRDGIHMKHSVLKMIRAELVDFIGSDVHNLTDRACHLSECKKNLMKKVNSRIIERIMWENANDIIQKKYNFQDALQDYSHMADENKIKHKPVKIRMNL